jgi:asparagine synthase (glutamine-hydrolysing)
LYYFNDRYGLGRIYYYQAPDGFYFSSEAKALLKVLPFLRELDVRSVGEFLSCDCVPQERPMFRGILILPAGSAWIFWPNVVLEMRRYFRPSTWEDQPRISPENYHKSVREIFLRVLKRYLQYPVGERGNSLRTKWCMLRYQQPELVGR